MIITKIEPKKPKKLRVACYGRVSTRQSNQEESYITQLKYFQGLINANPEWDFFRMYSDKGKSGTDTAHRPGFQQMIADGEAELYDIVLVKSVSRFGRNVGQVQQNVDILRAHNVTVIFQKDEIRTDDPTSSFKLSLIGAIAQDESHSIGENRRWTYQQRFERGEYNLGNNRILGYDTVDGKLTPNSDAPIIRDIFNRYVSGQNYTEIARVLNEKGVKTLRGSAFSFEAVRYIISNETYVGDKHLMKQPPTDYLTHKPDKNAVYKDYYLTDDHEGIVSRETWNAAQARVYREQEERKIGIMRGGDHHFLYGKVFCGECGSPYKRRTVTSSGHHYKMWNCRERQKGVKGNGCKMRNVKEDDLIAEICNVLGWTVDEYRMEREIERVDVFDDRIEIKLAALEESA